MRRGLVWRQVAEGWPVGFGVWTCEAGQIRAIDPGCYIASRWATPDEYPAAAVGKRWPIELGAYPTLAAAQEAVEAQAVPA